MRGIFLKGLRGIETGRSSVIVLLGFSGKSGIEGRSKDYEWDMG